MCEWSGWSWKYKKDFEGMFICSKLIASLWYDISK